MGGRLGEQLAALFAFQKSRDHVTIRDAHLVYVKFEAGARVVHAAKDSAKTIERYYDTRIGGNVNRTVGIAYKSLTLVQADVFRRKLEKKGGNFACLDCSDLSPKAYFASRHCLMLTTDVRLKQCSWLNSVCLLCTFPSTRPCQLLPQDPRKSQHFSQSGRSAYFPTSMLRQLVVLVAALVASAHGSRFFVTPECAMAALAMALNDDHGRA